MATADQGLVFDFNDPEVVQQWEKDLMLAVSKKCTIMNPEYGLIGDSNQFVVQRKKKLFEQGGTTATTTIAREFHQPPVYGNQSLRDQEEGMETQVFKWSINLLKKAAKVVGFRLTKQRVTWDAYQTSIEKLANYWPKVLEAGMCMHLAGFTLNGATRNEWYHDATNLALTMANVPQLPDALHIRWPNDLTDDSQVQADSSARFDLPSLTTLKTIANNLPIPIRMAKTPWGDKYVYLAHGYSIRHLKENSRWLATMRDTLRGGAIDGNPLWTGALGIYDDVVIVQADYLPPGMNGATIYRNVRRNVFCGAQALCLGFGKETGDENTFLNETESWEYGQSKGVAAMILIGAAAPRFPVSEQGDTEDYGKIVHPCYAQELVTSA